MTVEPHNTLKQLQRLYRTQTNARLARRIQGVYLAKMGLTCPVDHEDYRRVREVYDKDGKLQARYAKGQSLLKPGKECKARLWC